MNSLLSRSLLNAFRGSSRFSAVTCKKYSTAYESALTEGFYNEEQVEMQRSLKKIIETEINPKVIEWEAAEEFPSHEIFRKLGDAGFLGAHRPTEYGGLGLEYKYHSAILEELGTIHCGGIPMAIAVQTDIATTALCKFGSEKLKREFMEPSIRGTFVNCLGVTEPGAGSDVSSIKTNAVKDGNDLVINGEKMWITNGMKADWICLLANTSQGAPHRNKSLICVPMNSKGITRTKLHKIGMHSSDTAIIHFDNVRVPAENIIGEEGAGFMYQMLQFQDERLAGCLVVLKGMDLVIAQTIDYTRQRKAFGKSILDNQAVHFRLAELATEVEALRALTYKAVDLHCQGENVTRLASMAKLKAGRLTREVGDSCLQYWGGMGFSAETHVSRFYRDSRLLSIGAGADEVMLSIICKLIGTSPKSK